MKAWLANLMLSAFLAALRAGRRRGYEWMLQKADAWRTRCRRDWWQYKLKTILSQEDPDDDLLANALGKFFKFETPPEDSHWVLADDGVYVPGPGSGYIRNSRGDYLPAR
jgi:hypothetical protein